MKRWTYIASLITLLATQAQGQSISDLINQISVDTLSLKLKEFTGEIPTLVNGNSVTILNRQSNNNDLAADYLKQELMQFGNLVVEDQIYSANGRNIIATQLGKTNPDNIYVLCAHYDSVANYCADDNASGTIAVLEIARILSKQCLDNTIVYAFWDQEEVGLVGSNYYANQAANNGDNILEVLNIDMMGYDGDGDNDFDIDVRNIANSIAMKDEIISVLNTPEYGFTLNVNVVNPGTTASDHSRFWNNGYSAVLVGESWENDDQTPYYHSSSDRFATLNLPYYHELTKLILAYMATSGSLSDLDNSVTQIESALFAEQNSANYQWFDCDTGLPITNATDQMFEPTVMGNYSVRVTTSLCSEMSDCIPFTALNVDGLTNEGLNVYPNPVENELHIDQSRTNDLNVSLFDIHGKQILSTVLKASNNTINLKMLTNGFYFLTIKTSLQTKNFKLLKK